MEKLHFLRMINIKDDNESFDATYLARIVIRHSISLSTTDTLIRIFTESYNLKQFLEALSAIKELSQDVMLRVNEKRFLNELNKLLKYKYKDRIKNKTMKINCLLQVRL